jgi:hypothetical protein
LQSGDVLRYRVEARDRRPGSEPVATKEYQIRISADPAAADKQLEAFEKSQNPFREKLAELIASQAKVREKVESTKKKYEGLNDLDRLRGELADLAKQEQANADAGKQMSADLQRMASEAAKMPLMPAEIANELQALQDRFRRAAAEPLQSLADQIKQGSDAKQPPPDLPDIAKKADRLQADLESLRRHMDAIAKAEKNLRNGDLQAAVERLKGEMLKLKGDLTEAELKELKEFIARLREDLNSLEGEQDALRDAAKTAADAELDKATKEQSDFEKKSDPTLDEAKKLLESDKTRRMRKQNDPKGDDAPPARAEENDERKFAPRLGGDKPQSDPRFKKEPRTAPKKTDAGDPKAKRSELADRQNERGNDLDQADKSLASDEKAVGNLLDQLAQKNQLAKDAPGAPTPQGQPTEGEGSDAASRAMQELASMLNSPQMQQARQMAERMRAGPRGQQSAQSNRPNTNAAQPNLTGNTLDARMLDALLGKVDPETRAILLQMQPKVREELLQGMKDEGPEAYRKHIQDYFRRLSEVKK